MEEFSRINVCRPMSSTSPRVKGCAHASAAKTSSTSVWAILTRYPGSYRRQDDARRRATSALIATLSPREFPGCVGQSATGTARATTWISIQTPKPSSPSAQRGIAHPASQCSIAETPSSSPPQLSDSHLRPVIAGADILSLPFTRLRSF